MDELSHLAGRVFDTAPDSFEQTALSLFRLQARLNPVYSQYLTALRVDKSSIQAVKDIPFLPISLFKTHRVVTGDRPPEVTFLSSGTTGTPSQHLVADVMLYEESLTRGFEHAYGALGDLSLMALLPPPTSRPQSSLLYMVNHLMSLCHREGSAWFWDDPAQFIAAIRKSLDSGKKTIAISLSYKWLELAEAFPTDLQGAVLIETGGMKGRREVIREELHANMQRAFNVSAVCSEYGMTELLSQAYSTGKGLFRCPPWMRVLAREITDPFAYADTGQTGALNIIDLANIYSCAFIATDDLGRVHADGSFEVLGRLDNSDVRGCNLMV